MHFLLSDVRSPAASSGSPSLAVCIGYSFQDLTASSDILGGSLEALFTRGRRGCGLNGAHASRGEVDSRFGQCL